MDEETRKEVFSYAHISAIASVAGCDVERKQRPMDIQGIDILIEFPGTINGVESPKIDAQVKCTSQENAVQDGYVKVRISVRNYNKLRSKLRSSPEVKKK